MAKRVPKGSGSGSGNGRFNAQGPLKDTNPPSAPQAPDNSDLDRAQAIAQGQAIGQVLQDIALLIRSKGEGLVQAIGSIAARMAGPEFGPIIGGVFSIIGALRKSKPQKVEVVNEPIVHFARESFYGFFANPATAALGARLMATGPGFGNDITVNINKGPGIGDMVVAEVTKAVSRKNFNQGKRR